jgi:uncharacterized membrane protein YqiK
MGILVGTGVLTFLIVGFAVLVKNFYRKVLPGQALINNKTGKGENATEVSFQGSLVLPIIHKAETMDISVKTIELARTGKEGLICQDNIRADIKVTFFVRVSPTAEDVRRVAQSIGCARASDQRTLEELFVAKFSEALKTVGYQMNFVDLYTQRDNFKDAIINVIGQDLNGYSLEDAAIDFLEQTPIEALDPDNILDSEGIRAITAITSEKSVHTNLLQNEEKKRIKKQDVETREAVLALERQQAVAEATQAREVANVRAREKAEIERVQAEEYLKAEQAKIKAREEVDIANQNKERQVAVAEKNKERVIAVETERVEKDRALEQIIRERETALQDIDKEKALEKEKKEIADVIRGRVAVEKTVAEEEERIKDLRATMTANRNRDVVIISAEAEAQEKLVKDIKAAEAQEKSATHLAKERLIMADADLEAADRLAKAKIREAEGTRAEVAAPGLAEATVIEARASAAEKRGLVDARVTKEQAMAEAEGNEAKGMSNVRVKEADAGAVLKFGQSEAEVEKLALLAKAKGKEEDGLADVRVKEADAQRIQKVGQAEAIAIRERGTAEAETVELKLQAEAKGLTEKAEAMKLLDGVGRAHEEFRIALEKEKEVEFRALEAQQRIAHYQANVLGEAFKNTKIDIVGGDGDFFDKFVNAVGYGKSLDGFMNKSNTASKALGEYMGGDRSLPADLTQVLTRPKVGAGEITQLSVAAFLNHLMRDASGDDKSKVTALIKAAEKLGIEGLSPRTDAE